MPFHPGYNLFSNLIFTLAVYYNIVNTNYLAGWALFSPFSTLVAHQSMATRFKLNIHRHFTKKANIIATY
jgi:hypothetical protein